MMPREDLPYCDCRWLEEAAHASDCPIEFDPRLNEYHLVTSTRRQLILYHCPFCAGRAPDSLRSQLFFNVSGEEMERLHHLTSTLTTEEEVRARLGEPTHIYDPGAFLQEPEKDGVPGEIRVSKTLVYENQSETADIRVNVNRHGKVSIAFSGKYIDPAAKA